MIGREREKELMGLFDEYKRDINDVEKLLKQQDLPSNFGPVIKEQIEHRVVGKALRGIMYRDDVKEIYQQKAEAIKAFYDSLRKQGFSHKTALTIVCDTEGDDAGVVNKAACECEEDEE
jgi:hypothetical protein